MKKEKGNSFSKRDILILGIIIVLALFFRLYKINSPLADYHSWRQADTAAVARNFVKDGFDLLHPRYDDLSNVQSGIENPQGYRFVEFPIYNALFGGLFALYPSIPLEIYGRLVSILSSLVIIGCIYYLLKKEVDRTAAIAGSLLFALFPFFVYFSRVVLPEPTAVAFLMVAIVLLYKFLDDSDKQNWLFYVFSLLCFSVALLIKPTVIFFGLVLLYLYIKKYDIGVVKKIHFYLYFIVSLIPLVAWRYYILQFPEGIPYSEGLIKYVSTSEGKLPIFLRPAFFRWIFFERINDIILGGYMATFLVLGILAKHKNLLFLSMLASALMYLLVFEGGNVQHEYYQYLVLPVIALFVGMGVSFIIKNSTLFVSPFIITSIIGIIFIISLAFSYDRVKGYYDYSPDLPYIAKIISTLTKPTDKIITQRTGDTTLLYLANRRGSPVLFKSLEEMKTDGYTYLVASEPDLIKDLKQNNIYPIIFENGQFTLFKL